MIRLTPVVKQLAIAFIVFYAASFLLAAKGIIDLNHLLSLHYFLSPDFQPWQVITHMFMHSPIDLTHLVFNTFALIMFGGFMERFIGSKRFLELFIYSGIGSVLINYLVDAFLVYQAIGEWFPSYSNLDIQLQGDKMISFNPMYTQDSFKTVSSIYLGSSLGASGALYGVMAALAFLFPNTEFAFIYFPQPIKAKYFVPFFVALDIYMAIQRNPNDNVGHIAHIGGALTGFLYVYYKRKFDRKNFF